MKVNAVSFSAGRFSGTIPTAPNRKSACPNTYMRSSDIIPISGIIGASLVSAYFMRKGQIDTIVKMIRL